MPPAPTNGHNPHARRRGLRYALDAPLDITVLRRGIPDTVPGRLLNLGPGGVAAVLAAELSAGEKVAIEIRLPLSLNPLRTRALVRHHNKLHYGLEFVGLSKEQKKAIRNWAEKAKPRPQPGVRGPSVREKALEGGGSDEPPELYSRLGANGWFLLAVSAALLLAVLLWRWNRGWDDLESGLRKSEAIPRAEAQVSAEVMQKLITHKVDPEYPAAARPRNLQAVILLDVVVGRDGSVVSVRSLGGPEVLAQAAVDALRWWRFQPYRVDGKPVVVETTVAVEFKP
jgi:TonB family protein